MVSKYEWNGQMDRSLVDVTYDYWFKYLFFDDSPLSKAMLKHLLMVFLPEYSIDQVERLDESILNANGHMVQERVDGACRINERDLVIVEMQRRYHKGDEDRFVRYVNGLHEYRRRKAMRLDQGRNIAIILLCEAMKGQIAYPDHFIQYRSPKGDVFSHTYQIKLVNLYGRKGLLKKEVEELSSQERYCLWMRYGHRKEYEEVMKEIMAKEEGIQMAEKRIAESMDDKKLFHEIMSDIKRYCDEEQRMMMQEELEKETQLRKQAEASRSQEMQLRRQAEAEKSQEAQLREKEMRLRRQAESELNKFQLVIEKMRNGMSYEEALAVCAVSVA